MNHVSHMSAITETLAHSQGAGENASAPPANADNQRLSAD